MAMIKEINDTQFKTEVLEYEGTILVDFWAPWCGPCRLLAPVLELVADKFSDQLKVVKVNVDDNPYWASSLGVRGIPTLCIFKNGTLLTKLVGYHSEPELTHTLGQILTGEAA